MTLEIQSGQFYTMQATLQCFMFLYDPLLNLNLNRRVNFRYPVKLFVHFISQSGVNILRGQNTITNKI